MDDLGLGFVLLFAVVVLVSGLNIVKILKKGRHERMDELSALPVPPEVVLCDLTKVRELARVWTSPRGMMISLAPTIWEDPACWGVVLSDMARHLADAYGELRGLDRKTTLDAIREALVEEWKRPTSPTRGRVVEGA